MNLEELNGLFDKIGSFDFSRVTTPEYSFQKIDIPSVEAISIDPEDTIMGDIKRQIQAQNELASQQINILLEQQQIKFLCKWAVENSNRPLADAEKEILKQAIDNAKNIEDLLAIALSAATVN